MKNLLVEGVGINDIEGCTLVNGKQGKDYQLWRDMLRRCFSRKEEIKMRSYKHATCEDSWLLLSNFVKDISSLFGYQEKGWHLDKDILIKGNKHYSLETCCFVPSEINNLFTESNHTRGLYPVGVYFSKDRSAFRAGISINGKTKNLGYYNDAIDAFNAYKSAKEEQIKVVAEKWKGIISDNVYLALCNYEVSIND